MVQGNPGPFQHLGPQLSSIFVDIKQNGDFYTYLDEFLRIYIKLKDFLKFGDGDGPNLCTVKKVDVSSTFIENIFRSGLNEEAGAEHP